MTKFGLRVWSKLVYQRIGFQEFIHKELPKDLQSISDLRNAAERGYVQLVRKHYYGGHANSYRNVYKVTRKGAGELANEGHSMSETVQLSCIDCQHKFTVPYESDPCDVNCPECGSHTLWVLASTIVRHGQLAGSCPSST